MPLGILQHYTIEPSNLEKTRKFYCEVLGLKNGDRPPLGFPGYWLYSGDVPTVHLLGKRKPRNQLCGKLLRRYMRKNCLKVANRNCRNADGCLGERHQCRNCILILAERRLTAEQQ